MTSKINIDGKEFDLKLIDDRTIVYQILKDKMKDCEPDFYEVVKE